MGPQLSLRGNRRQLRISLDAIFSCSMLARAALEPHATSTILLVLAYSTAYARAPMHDDRSSSSSFSRFY